MFKIIMPVYNAEEYLEKAVDSIIPAINNLVLGSTEASSILIVSE